MLNKIHIFSKIYCWKIFFS